MDMYYVRRTQLQALVFAPTISLPIGNACIVQKVPHRSTDLEYSLFSHATGATSTILYEWKCQARLV